MKVLFIDCGSGIAGDMLLGALLDAGADERAVRQALDALHLDGWELQISEVARAGIRAGRADVRLTQAEPARRYDEIVAILQEAELDEKIRSRSLEVFSAMATAEAKVHGRDSLDDIHLHELGATDALIDVVGVCAALQSLGMQRVTSSPVPLGSGRIDSAHGPLPVPAPAVLELLRGAPVVGGGEGEMVTPTGAALLRALSDGFGEVPAMQLHATGYGAGARDLAQPNVVRVLIGESVERTGNDAVLIEANLDDMAPELLPHVIARLIEAGAHDAWVTPIVMKKGRPAFTLSVLGDIGERDRLLDIVYRETTTLGTRTSIVTKDELDRGWVEVSVEGQPVRVKLGRRAGETVTVSPEHDDAARAARATGLPLKEVYAAALRAATEQLRLGELGR